MPCCALLWSKYFPSDVPSASQPVSNLWLEGKCTPHPTMISYPEVSARLCTQALPLRALALTQPNSIMWSMHILAKDGGKPETWMDVCASIMEVHKCQQCGIIDLSRIYYDFSLSYNTFSMRSRHSWLSSKSTLVQSMFSDVYSCNTKTGLRTGIVQR
jgi:hypothetical protein